MQKVIIISCCAECPAYRLISGVAPFCGKLGRRTDECSGNFTNPALVGFPDWCPLESFSAADETNIDYKKEIKKIMQITEDGSPDAIQEAAYYLNSIIKNVKKS